MPSEPSFHPIWQIETPVAGHGRQRSYEASAVPILKTALHPIASIQNEMACIQEQLNVAEWCLVWIVERHVAPPVPNGSSSY